MGVKEITLNSTDKFERSRYPGVGLYIVKDPDTSDLPEIFVAFKDSVHHLWCLTQERYEELTSVPAASSGPSSVVAFAPEPKPENMITESLLLKALAVVQEPSIIEEVL